VAAELARRMRQQDGPIVLRLPEVPPGTVALHAVGSTNVYSWPGDDLAQILEAEPEGVTAELAPAPEPKPRTAAEVWAGMREALRAELGDQGEFGELVDALDREAEL